MVEFEESEKLAMIRVMEELAKADNKLKPEEMDYLVNAARIFHWDEEDIQRSKDLSLKKAGKALRQMDSEKRKIFKNMVLQLADVDGIIEGSELRVILDTFLSWE